MGKSTSTTKTWKSGVQFFDVSGRTPVLCEVWRVAKGVVYYRSIDSDGPEQRSNLAEFEQIAVRIASVQTDDESDVFLIQPDDMHRLILKALENGATFAEIGELIGLDAMLVRRLAKRLGFKPKAVPNHYNIRSEYSVEQEKAVLEALESGATYYEAGRRIERGTGDARYIADKYFVSEHSQYTLETETAIVEAIEAGATIADIERIVPEGFQYKTLKLIALKHGLTFSKRRGARRDE